MRLYARVGAALVAAREQGADPFAAIEAIVSWEAFSESVLEAGQLDRDENFNPLALITERYPQLRRYGPTLLETFEFRPDSVARDLIEGDKLLRRMNREGLRQVPADAPVGFIRKGWAAYVFGSDGEDRRFYELCVMAELKNALRSGDVSVSGSRQFRDFEDYLMPKLEFRERLVSKTLHVAAGEAPVAYLEERIQTLKAALTQTDALAGAGQLPDAELNGAGLKIAQLENSVPKEAEALRNARYRLMPHVKITDLLMEVDRWTGLSRHSTHLKTNDPGERSRALAHGSACRRHESRVWKDGGILSRHQPCPAFLAGRMARPR